MKNFDNMTEPEIFDLIDGLFAYSNGSTSSGIKDDLMKQELVEWLIQQFTKPENEHSIIPKILNRFAALHFFSEEALKQGYGLSDCHSFLKWLEEIGVIEL